MKNPRPDGFGGYERVIDVILRCEDWGLHYYNMPPETVGWGDYSKYKPDADELGGKFADILERIKDISTITDVIISMHASAYNVMTSDDPVILDRSVKEINAERRALEMCEGVVLYIHPGYDMKNPVNTREKLAARMNELAESRVPLGIEVDDVGIGDLDTVLYLASEVQGAVPVVDFGHMYGRGYKLESSQDFLDVLEMVRPLSGKRVFTHFSAVSKRKHIPLEEGLPDYRLFASAAAQFEWQGDSELVVLIESPRRELDAILFKNAFNRAAGELIAAA